MCVRERERECVCERDMCVCEGEREKKGSERERNAREALTLKALIHYPDGVGPSVTLSA